MGDEPSIDVTRRRKGNKPTSRAEAPVRQTTGGGGSGASRPTGGSLPTIPTGGKLGGCGGVLVIILIIGYVLLTGGGGGSNEVSSDQYQTEENVQVESNPVAENLPTNTPRPTREAVSGQTGQTWLVMLYQDADDQILEQDIYTDLNEAELTGSTDRVTIVSQIDRFRGAYQGDGNWNSTRRYLVTRDDDLTAIHSDLIEELGEANMADGGTLVDFVTWAMQNYSADRYVLILSDHGMGWPGGWSDPAPGGTDAGSAPLISALDGDNLFLSEIDQALGQIRQQTGLEKFDIIGMDACLMSQLEVYAALQPHGLFAVASEETEPSLGWAYAAFLEKLVSNPDLSSEQLVAEIVSTYVEQDERIVDDQARAEFLRQGSPMGSFFSINSVSAAQLARQIGKGVTLTGVDLSALPDLMSQFNNFVYVLQSEDQSAVASARTYAQSYTSIFGKEVPPSYIDLGNFVQLTAKQAGSSAVDQAATAVMDALNRLIVAEKHGSGKPGSTGVAIYFPNSTLYRSAYTGLQSYSAIANRFVKNSLWDDFLAFHYSNRSFESDAVEAVSPATGGSVRAPGAGDISVQNITTSSDTAAPGDPVRLSASISGENIGYIYLFIGLYDTQSNSIYVADTDFLESSESNESGGVYYPVWPESESFTINFEWDPTLFSISDGTTTSLALFNPAVYGASADEAVYIVKGTYTFSDSGEQRSAQLQFMDGKLAQIFGYKGQDDAGAPAEITPSRGDTFTISQKWLELDSNGNVNQVVYEPGDTLTFGPDTALTWEEVYAPAGEYLVGFQVSDLDGNMSQAYTRVSVR